MTHDALIAIGNVLQNESYFCIKERSPRDGSREIRCECSRTHVDDRSRSSERILLDH